MNKVTRNHNIFNTCLCGIILLWLCPVHIRTIKAEGNQFHYSKGHYYQCNEDWLDKSGHKVNISKIKFTRSDLNKEHAFNYLIPDSVNIGDGDSLCFFSRGIDFKVYITADEESRQIFEYAQAGAGLTGNDIGLVMQTVPISKCDSQHKITFLITPTETTAFLMDMKLQDTSTFVRETIHSRIPMLIESLLILFYGIVVIVYTMFAIRKRRQDKTMLYAWGAFSICIGGLTGIQSQVFQFLTGKPEFLNALKYIFSILMVFPQAVQIDSSSKHSHKHFSFVIGIIVAITLLIETISISFFGHSLYRLILITALPLLTFNFITAIVYFIKDVKYCRKNKAPAYSIYALATLAILCTCAAIDILLYVAAGRRMLAWGDIMRNSYIIFVFIMLIALLRVSIDRNKELNMTELYKAEARTDALTGFLNKGAYIKKEAELTSKLLNARNEGQEDYSFVIMSLDLNNLKKVNDNLGHDAGDKYIKSACQIIKDSVGRKGESYRVGGDEFLILIFGDNPEEEYQKITAALEEKIQTFNDIEKMQFPLSMAYGHAICKAGQDHSIHDSERQADQEMYECKKRMKVTRE